MGLQRLLRRAHVLHDAHDQPSAVCAVGERLVRQHQAMAQHVGHEIGDVLGQHVVRPRRNASARAPSIRWIVARGLAPNVR